LIFEIITVLEEMSINNPFTIKLKFLFITS
jgi:hypothetical protein